MTESEEEPERIITLEEIKATRPEAPPPIVAPSIEEEGPFFQIKQNQVTNALLLTATTKRNTTENPEKKETTVKNGYITITYPTVRGEGKSPTKKIEGFNPNTTLLFLALLKASNGRKQAILDLNEYIRNRGKLNVKKALEQINNDLWTLYTANIHYTNPKHEIKGDVRIIQEKSVDRNGYLTIVFSDKLYKELLTPGEPLTLPDDIFSADTKNYPNSVHLLGKLAIHSAINKKRNNTGIFALSIKSLLANSPYIPTIEEVQENGRQIYQRIIRPFFRDMAYLERWYNFSYYDKKGEEVTEDTLTAITYKAFTDLIVKYSIKNNLLTNDHTTAIL
jgi:hypothetical protein